MHAIRGIVMQVAEIDIDRVEEVPQGEVLVADLGSEDRLHDCRQRRVPRRQGVVVLEVGQLLFGGEVVALQEQRQHHVGLLHELLSILNTWYR